MNRQTPAFCPPDEHPGVIKKVWYACAKLACKILHMSYQQFMELFLYLFFGVLTTLVNYAVFFFFTSWVILIPDEGINVLVVNIIAWVISVIFALVTNKIWVFQSRDFSLRTWVREGVPFVIARLLSLGMEMGILLVFVTWLGYNKLIIKAIAAILVIVFNYVASKLVIFKKKPASTGE